MKKSDGQEKKGSSGSSPVKFVTEYEQLIDRPIQSGETLRSISLKYRIPVRYAYELILFFLSYFMGVQKCVAVRWLLILCDGNLF